MFWCYTLEVIYVAANMLLVFDLLMVPFAYEHWQHFVGKYRSKIVDFHTCFMDFISASQDPLIHGLEVV